MFFLPNIPKKLSEKVKGIKERYREKIDKMTPIERESKLARLKAVVTSFFAELFGLEKEKNEASGKADKSIEKTTDEALKGIKESVEVDSSVKGEARESIDQAVAFVTASVDQNLNGAQKGYFSRAFDKIKKPSDGPMTADELKTSAAVGFLSFRAMKKAYPTESALAAAFEGIEKSGENSAFAKLFDESVVRVFKVGTSDGLKILEKFNVTPSGGDFIGALTSKIGIEVDGDASEFVNTFKSIKEPGVPKIDAIAKVMEEKGVIKHDAPKVIRAVNKLIVDGVTPLSLARLVRAVDDRDLVRLAALFLDKKPEDIKDIKIPDLETVSKKAA